jgi:hypothetical protein
MTEKLIVPAVAGQKIGTNFEVTVTIPARYIGSAQAFCEDCAAIVLKRINMLEAAAGLQTDSGIGAARQ